MRPTPLIPFLFSVLGPAAWAQAPVPQVDLHLDTPTQLLNRSLSWDAPVGLEAGLGQLAAGGTNLPVMVLWPPRNSDHAPRTLALLGVVEREIERIEGVGLVRTPAQARQAVAAGQVGVLVALEGAHGLAQDDWRASLHGLHQRGLSLLGLTWSMSNRFAGSSGDDGAGLTEEGRALVSLARSLGIVLDVSHASRQTTMEVCTDSPVPVIASHSNAHAVRAVGRNLTDAELRCIGQSGGVVGLNFHATFVSRTPDIAGVADHADHIRSVAGPGVVALGSDFDGFIKKPAGLPDAGQIPALLQELAGRGWTDAELRGLRGENFLRAWAAVQAGAATAAPD